MLNNPLEIPEILIGIFTECFDSYRDLSNFQLVSRAWRGPARALMYQELVINWRYTEATRLLRTLQDPELASLVGYCYVTGLNLFVLQEQEQERIHQEAREMPPELSTKLDWFVDMEAEVRENYSRGFRTLWELAKEAAEAHVDCRWLRPPGEQEALQLLGEQLLPRLTNLRELAIERMSSLDEDDEDEESELPTCFTSSKVLDVLKGLRTLSLDSDPGPVGQFLLSESPNIDTLYLIETTHSTVSLPLTNLFHLNVKSAINNDSDFKITLPRTLRTLDISTSEDNFDLVHFPPDDTPLSHLSHFRILVFQKSLPRGPALMQTLSRILTRALNLQHFSCTCVKWMEILTLLPISVVSIEITLLGVSVDADTLTSIIKSIVHLTSLRFFSIYLAHVSSAEIDEKTVMLSEEVAEVAKLGVSLKMYGEEGKSVSTSLEYGRMVDLWKEDQRQFRVSCSLE